MDKASTLAALGSQDSPHILVLPVCGNNIAMFHVGRAFSLPMASPTGQEATETAVRRLVDALGGMMVAAISVELWRADVASAAPRPALATDGLQWRPTAWVQRRDCWRRAHLAARSASMPFAMGDANDGAAGIASLSVLTSSSPSTSLLPDLLVSQQSDPFLQQVAASVKDSDEGVWRDLFRNKEVSCAINVRVMLGLMSACPRRRETLYSMRLMGGHLSGIRGSRVQQPTLLSFLVA